MLRHWATTFITTSFFIFTWLISQKGQLRFPEVKQPAPGHSMEESQSENLTQHRLVQAPAGVCVIAVKPIVPTS